MTEELSGWGRWPSVLSELLTPRTEQEAVRALKEGNPIISRGLGRSYGDPALPAKEGGRVLSGLGLKRFISFDESTGLLVAESGVSLAEIIEAFLPRGWFLPTTPGTKYVTLGGAVAADVHGKNHHVDGTFGAHVDFLDLALVNGRVIRCSPQENADVFGATVGGMGLTGHILKVGVRLRRVPSAWCKVRYIKALNLDSLLDALKEHDSQYRHTVAWVDCLSGGHKLGRGILMLGNEAQPSELGAKHAANPHVLPKRLKLRVPFDFPSWALARWSVSAFNALYYAMGRDCEKLVDFDKFFYPLDTITDWNRIYGKRGFIQYQVYFPDDTARVGMRQTMDLLSESGLGSFLAVLKRSGPANSFPLSFLSTGYTLALDIPILPGKLDALMVKLEAVLKECQGRVYFAKDACVVPELVPQMYPRVAEFRRVKAQVDPHNQLRSRLSDRIGLT